MQGLLFKRIILVFQMGKVGSLSAFFAIERSLGQNWRTSEWSRETRDTILIHSHRGPDIELYYRSMILWRARLGLPLKIICPIREPIARDVSVFFHFYIWYLHRRKYPDLLANVDLRELEELFLTVPSHRQVSRNRAMAEHQFTLNWFDEHFKPQLHIDVYKQPFPKDRKWQIYRRGFTRVLVYRIDLKRSEQAKLISRFLGIKLDETRLKNAGKNKNYAELYSRFHESVKLPEQYIRRMHDSRFAQHFWSPQELKAAADKWRATPSN